jgi:hypothetical protein
MSFDFKKNQFAIVKTLFGLMLILLIPYEIAWYVFNYHSVEMGYIIIGMISLLAICAMGIALWPWREYIQNIQNKIQIVWVK